MNASMSKDPAAAFARDWIEAWNAHDLPRILSHYSEDFSMTSPKIVELAGEASGTLHGKAAVAAYWRAALERMPDLRFELLDVLRTPGSVVIYYRNHAGITAAEIFFFGDDGRVNKAAAHYSSGVK